MFKVLKDCRLKLSDGTVKRTVVTFIDRSNGLIHTKEGVFQRIGLPVTGSPYPRLLP